MTMAWARTLARRTDAAVNAARRAEARLAVAYRWCVDYQLPLAGQDPLPSVVQVRVSVPAARSFVMMKELPDFELAVIV